MAVTASARSAARTVSIVASGALAAALRAAVVAEPDLQLNTVAPRFTDLVVDADFPGDVVVLAEEPGRQLFAHAVTAMAAGAAVVVHADAEAELLRSLEEVGAVVVPLGDTGGVVEQVSAVRPVRRHGGRRAVDDAHRRPRLSAGERRALAHYVQGLTTVQVAAEMGVGYETAKTFLRRVRSKYAAVDRPAGKRIELSQRAEEDGIL